MITLCILNSDTHGAEEKKKISSGPGEPSDSYPLELPDPRVLAFDLQRMVRDSEATKKQQCQVDASPIAVDFGMGDEVVRCGLFGLGYELVRGNLFWFGL